MTALTPAQQDMQAWQAEAGRVPGNYRFVTGSAQSFLEGWNYRDRRQRAVEPTALSKELRALLTPEDRMHPIGCQSWLDEALYAMERAAEALEHFNEAAAHHRGFMAGVAQERARAETEQAERRELLKQP